MDIRVNDDTIPKKTINMKLKNNTLGKSHKEGRYETQETDLIARQPKQKWKQ
jgi:hypothetical protein